MDPVLPSTVQTVPRGLAPPTILRRGLTRGAPQSQLRTVLEVPGKPTTRAPGLTRGAHLHQTPTVAKQSVKPTTQKRVPMAPRIKLPTLMETPAARSSQRTARRRTPNIKRPRKDRWERYKLRAVARVLPRPVQAAVQRRVKRQMATNTRPQTGMYTRTPGAVGSKLRGLRNRAQVTREPMLQQRDGDSRRTAAGHQPLAAAAAAAVGNPGGRAPAVRRAAVGGVVGAVAGRAYAGAAKEAISCKRLVRVSSGNFGGRRVA